MLLTTNGVLITDAIKYVIQKQEQLDNPQKVDGRIEQTQGAIEENDQTSTNRVF